MITVYCPWHMSYVTTNARVSSFIRDTQTASLMCTHSCSFRDREHQLDVWLLLRFCATSFLASRSDNVQWKTKNSRKREDSAAPWTWEAQSIEICTSSSHISRSANSRWYQSVLMAAVLRIMVPTRQSNNSICSIVNLLYSCSSLSAVFFPCPGDTTAALHGPLVLLHSFVFPARRARI